MLYALYAQAKLRTVTFRAKDLISISLASLILKGKRSFHVRLINVFEIKGNPVRTMQMQYVRSTIANRSRQERLTRWIAILQSAGIQECVL